MQTDSESLADRTGGSYSRRMPTWLGVTLAVVTFLLTVELASRTDERTVRRVLRAEDAPARAARRAAGFHLGWFAVLLAAYVLAFTAVRRTGAGWAAAPFVLPATVWWGSRALVFALSEVGPTAPEIMRPTGATRGAARAVLAVSFPFVLLGTSASLPAVLVSVQVF